jgi:lipoprotein-anchoring transpeptidase ErfK/SrfK
VSSAVRPVDLLFSQAKLAARAADRAEARRLLWLALQLDPDRPELWIWLAGVAPSARASLGYLARALTLDPDNKQARAGLRWARRRAMGAPSLTVSVPQRVPESPLVRKPYWVGGLVALLAAVLAASLAGSVLFPGWPTALAAWDATPKVATVVSLVQFSPLSLPTRTPELPPTWTPAPSLTPTSTPTPKPTLTFTPTPTETPSSTPTPVAPSPTPVPPVAAGPGSNGERWIDVDLSDQLLTAYEGMTPVRQVLVSTGLPGTATVVGQFRIYVKYESTLMTGDDYYLPNVPYTMYFYKGYGLHGTYWHSNFGRPMSHGCVNLPTPEAQWLYGFASIGTLVNIHY